MKRKITPDAYFVILLILSVLFHFIFPVTTLLPYPYSLNGLLLVITGIILVFRTNYLLLKNRTSLQPFETPSAFIISGSFRLSRNPIYLGMLIILIGAVMILGTLSSFVFPLLFFIILNQTIIPQEESILEKLFGNQYHAYKTKVRRWV
jgi:protein-S-isoprenylcysteine O-methyltransferase Ste14